MSPRIPPATINVYTARTSAPVQVANVVKTFLNDSDIDEVVYNPSGSATVTYDDKSTVLYEVNLVKFSSDEDVTMQEVFEDAFAYEYKDGYTYKGEALEIKGTKVTGYYTSTQLSTGKDVMNDMARLLGALYRAGGAREIVYDKVTYTWDADKGLTGSNWVDADGNTLVSAIVADFSSGSITGASVKLTVDDIDITFAVDTYTTPGA